MTFLFTSGHIQCVNICVYVVSTKVVRNEVGSHTPPRRFALGRMSHVTFRARVYSRESDDRRARIPRRIP
jgi:hypothetical protein